MYTVNFSSFETQSHTAVVVVVPSRDFSVFTAGALAMNLILSWPEIFDTILAAVSLQAEKNVFFS